MQNKVTEPECISFHIFFNGDIYSAACDRIINSVAAPFICLCKANGWIDKYFFIRYSELGPHIRLRLFINPSTTEEIISKSFEDLIAIHFPQDLSPVIKNNNHNSELYLKINYEPEVERYGGEEAIKVAEEFFYYSSEFCLEQIKSLKDGDNSIRFGKSLIAMVMLLKIFSGVKDFSAQLMINYRSGYLRSFAKEEYQEEWLNMFNGGFEKQSASLINYVNQLWDAIDEVDELPDSLTSFYNGLVIIKDKLIVLLNSNSLATYNRVHSTWNEVVGSIIPSYIHMTNNRLGISVRDESYLAHLINCSLTKTVEVEK